MSTGAGRRRSGRGAPPTKQLLQLTQEEIDLFGGPRCLCYGSNRKEVPDYSDFFFCGQCDNAEQHRAATGQWPDLNSRRNKCTANHTSWIQPTHRKPTSSRIWRGLREEVAEDTAEDDDGSPVIANLSVQKHAGGDGSWAQRRLSSLDQGEWKSPSTVDASFKYLTETAAKDPNMTLFFAHNAGGNNCAGAMSDGELVGIVGLERQENVRQRRRAGPGGPGRAGDSMARLALMWTKIRYQRQGVTTAVLLAALQDEAASTIITSQTNPTEFGRAFYEGYGFQKLGIATT